MEILVHPFAFAAFLLAIDGDSAINNGKEDSGFKEYKWHSGFGI